MKKVLLGLVIAVMMTGSGYAAIWLNSNEVSQQGKQKELNEFCFDAMRKGKLINLNDDSSIAPPSYLYKNSIVTIRSFKSTMFSLQCTIRDTFIKSIE